MSVVALAGGVAAGVVAAMVVTLRWVLGSQMEAVARACHELRGPLTAARLGLSLHARAGDLSAEGLRAIDTELGRATLALEDLSQCSRRGPSPRELETVDLRALLADCVRAADGLADRWGAGITHSWEGPWVPVWGDRLRLAQALGNLIANAVQHGGGGVEVRGVVEEAVVRIEVSDQGPGLPLPIDELIRRPRRGRGAHGRGLAIAAAIVETHGGRVLTAAAQQGARVVLELPRVPASLAG